MWPFAPARWQAIATSKRDVREKLLGKAVEPASERPVYLTATAPDIVHRIGQGEWTASDVLEAYISQAKTAQGHTNCLTEILFEDARAEARSLDKLFHETGRVKGPLHGVPVSFKDIYNVRGYDSTLGSTGRANQPATEDADLVRFVREAGGIPFVKTNVPQTLMFFECVNPLWGRTLNPYSEAHTSGGSSGGCAALLAIDGSALGWGSDIGGSLRIPPSYSGIYALKPGYGRISLCGAVDNLPGFEAVHTVAGPMGRSVADIELAARVVFGREGEDQMPAPIPYRDVKLPAKLKFGFYTFDGFIKSSPVCKRAVLETVEALRREGHECIEFAIPEPLKAAQLFMSFLAADGNKTLFSPIGHDPQQFELACVALGPKLWGWLNSSLSWVVENVLGDGNLAPILRASRKRSVDGLYKQIDEARQYAKRFHTEVWEKHQFDGIIAPVQAVPALPHGAVAYVAGLSGSTILYNVVDSPVGVVPVTRVDPDKDFLTSEWTDLSKGEHGSNLLEGLLYTGKKAIYNAEKMADLPVGIQVVGRKWEDEKVIEMMKVVDGALGKRNFGPGSWRKFKDQME